MELGSFLAGFVISSQGREFSEKIFITIEPVKDVFSAVFFASLGKGDIDRFLCSNHLYLKKA
jgi:Kef-type K+ transport system membrane component KefB